MVFSNENRKLFKAFSDDGAVYADVSVKTETSRASEVRKLYKAFLDNPALHAAVRACKSPAEKHELIRKAGYTPVSQAELKAELAKCFAPSASGTAPAHEDTEFLDDFLHLASATSTDLGV